jgi:hypothetical protein
MLRFGFPERAYWFHLGDHLARPKTRGLDVGNGVESDASLLVVHVEDRGPVARPDVVALAVPRRRVVNLEKELEQVSI